MLFAIYCADKPGSLERRLAARPSHLAYLLTFGDKVVQAGPLLDVDGRPCGSLFLLDVAGRTEAEDFAAGDPYAAAGLFESTIIRAFRFVFQGGEQVAS